MPQLIMVAQAAVASMCNDAATNASADGRTPFDVPLRRAGDATNTPVAYWCCWTMTATVAGKIKTWMTNHGATPAETAVYSTGSPPPAGNRAAIFDAASTSPAEVLAVLGLDVLSAG